jgi:hypothetical protein
MVAAMVQHPASFGANNKLFPSGTSQFTHKDSDPEGVRSRL